MTSVAAVPGHRRRTKLRTTQIDGEVWDVAQRIAELRGETLAAVMRNAVKRYVARHRHLLNEQDEQPPS